MAGWQNQNLDQGRGQGQGLLAFFYLRAFHAFVRLGLVIYCLVFMHFLISGLPGSGVVAGSGSESNPGNSLGYGKHGQFGTCPIRETLWDTGNTVSLEHVQSGKLSGIRETRSVWNMSNPGNSLGYGKHGQFGTCPIRETLWDTGNTVSLEHVQSGKLSGIRETRSVWNMSNPGNSLRYGKHGQFGTCPIRETLWDTGNTVSLEHVQSGKLRVL